MNADERGWTRMAFGQREFTRMLRSTDLRGSSFNYQIIVF